MTPETKGRSNRMHHPLTSISIILAVALFAYLLSLSNFFQTLEFQLYDMTFQLRGERSIIPDSTSDDPEIVVVAIDQETADELSFPFDRRHYATLIKKLNMLGAKWIVIDVDFSSVGRSSESDSLLKAAISEAGNVILSGKIDFRYQRGIAEPIKEPKPAVKQVAPPGTPWGLVNEFVDPDGITRRYALFLSARDTTYLSLGLKTYVLEKGRSGEELDSVQIGNFRYAGLSIPRTTDVNTTLLNYYGPAGTFPVFSFIHIISGEYDFDFSEEEIEILKMTGMWEELFADNPSPFQGKIVLIGATAEDLQDNKFTPFFNEATPLKTPGVEVHANALKMFFDQSFIKAISLWWILGGVLLISILLYLNGRYLPTWAGGLASILLLGIIAVGGIALFTKYQLWLREIPLFIAVVLGYPANLLYRIIIAQKEKAMIRGMFAQYVPKKVTDALIENPDLMVLGGERRRMSVLFTDIAGFTTVSEKLSVEELVELLNEYLTAMTDIILENDGIIDKYEGDLVMAEFGAPVWYEDHAARCCRASLRMQAKLKRLRKKWREEGRSPLYSRVGVNSGVMIVGNMGSQQVFDYTVMGDAVNLSSRLEGANKGYDTTIMIGHETWLDVHEEFVTRPLDFLRVKGKTKPVPVYELLAEDESQVSPEKLETLKIFGQGLELYRAMQFAEAKEFFDRAFEADPNDGPSKTFVKRCEMYIAEPPPEDWDRAWTLTEK